MPGIGIKPILKVIPNNYSKPSGKIAPCSPLSRRLNLPNIASYWQN